MEFSPRGDRVAAAERADRLRRLTELEAELATVRFTERLADAGVTAVVDGLGRLVELSIDDAMLRGPRPRVIGPGIISALAAARAKAGTEAAARMAELVRPQVPQPAAAPRFVPQPPAPAAPTRRRQLPREDDDDPDEGFRGFGWGENR
jgi:DNA-binding protein YbaB